MGGTSVSPDALLPTASTSVWGHLSGVPGSARSGTPSSTEHSAGRGVLRTQVLTNLMRHTRP
jgi:hypothetical protein